MAKPRIPQMPKKMAGLTPTTPDPAKAVTKPPKLRPVTTRAYSRGSTPLSGGPDMGLRGAGIGYGGPEDAV